MQKPTIGVQMMMLKDKIAQDGIRETFKKVKEIGFSTVELSQVEMSPENVESIKSALAEFDMKVCATSASIKAMMPGIKMENLKDDFDKIVADTKALGCKYIRIGMISFDCLGSKERIIEYTKELNEMGKKASTISRNIASIRSFFQFLVRKGKISKDPTANIQSPKIEKRVPSVLTDKEVELLLEQPKDVDLKGTRDKAMLEFAYATGMRVTEIISLNVEDVNLE